MERTYQLKPRNRTSNYSEDEVKELVENYEELVFRKDKLWLLVRLVDLEVALAKLSEQEARAVKLCGLIGLTTRVAGDTMGVSHTTVRRHYLRGLSKLTRLINGQAY